MTHEFLFLDGLSDNKVAIPILPVDPVLGYYPNFMIPIEVKNLYEAVIPELGNDLRMCSDVTYRLVRRERLAPEFGRPAANDEIIYETVTQRVPQEVAAAISSINQLKKENNIALLNLVYSSFQYRNALRGTTWKVDEAVLADQVAYYDDPDQYVHDRQLQDGEITA